MNVMTEPDLQEMLRELSELKSHELRESLSTLRLRDPDLFRKLVEYSHQIIIDGEEGGGGDSR
jgi:hypothetical protein